MGTQQLLLLALGVIIVGVAIAVGITMFHSLAYHSNQQAMIGDLWNYGAQSIQFWKTPMSQGGAGHIKTEVTAPRVANFLGFYDSGNTHTADDGIFRVAEVVTGGDTLNVILEGIGNNVKNEAYPFVTTTINLKRGIITAVIGTKAEPVF
jgi:hypothetical protein